MQNKKALTPLVATFMLVIFALIIGTVAMAWGKNYVASIPDEQMPSTITLSISQVNTPLKELQIKHLTGQLTEEQYLLEEQKIID